MTHTQRTEPHMYETKSTNYGNSSYAQATNGISAATPLVGKTASASTLDNIGRAVSDARQQVNDLAQRARQIADDVFGAMPTGESPTNVPSFPGKAGVVDEQVRGLLDSIAELRQQIDRLTCI